MVCLCWSYLWPSKITNPPHGSSAFLWSLWCWLIQTSRLDWWSIHQIRTATSAFGRCSAKHQSEYFCPEPPPRSQSLRGHHQSEPPLLGLFKVNWCWMETVCCSEGERKGFCISSWDFFLFGTAAPSSSSLTSSCLQVLCLFFPCIIFNLDE